MSKIELSVKINNGELTDEEQGFIKVWIKFLELVLEVKGCIFYIDTMKTTVENLKEILKRGGKG